MKPKSIVVLILGAVLAWLFSGGDAVSELDRPVKTVTETKGLYLFGLKRLVTLDKSVKRYRADGRLLEASSFDGDRCKSKYVYEYNAAGQQTTELWLTGKKLTAQRIEKSLYDSLNRNTQKLLYEVNKMQSDTLLREKTTYAYDSLNRKYQTTIQRFRDSASVAIPSTSLVFVDRFDHRNLKVGQKYYTEGVGCPPVVSRYYYDAQRHLVARSGGLLSDSIRYTSNERGEILREDKYEKGRHLSFERNWYDKRGNVVKTKSHYGSVFTYRYDPRNRLVRERLTGGIPLLLPSYAVYEYEFH